MNEQQNILIMRYLNGELTKEEKSAFEDRLLHDTTLQKDLNDYRQIVQVVIEKERESVKDNIAVIAAGIKPNELKDYKPQFPPPSNSSSWADIIKSILFFAFVITTACLALIYFNQFPIEHPAVEKIREKMILLDQTTTIRTDTIYQTIENGKITTDTVIYGKEELIEFLDELEEDVEEKTTETDLNGGEFE